MDELIDKLVEELFTNGTGKQADRLVLEMTDGHDGGGWSRKAMKSYIKTFMNDEQAELIANIRNAALNTAKFITDGRGLWSEHSTQERMQAAAGAMAVGDAITALIERDIPVTKP